MPPARGGCWIIIPAYREAAAIARVIGALQPLGHAIVVVDDGSDDGTGDVARACGVSVVRHGVNLGQGAALQTGIAFALRQGADYLVTFDADGQHDPADIAGLLAPLEARTCDFALGSRFLGRVEGASPFRLRFLRLAALFTRVTTGLRLTDAHNGMRAMTRRGASHVWLRQNRMAHASEILHQIAASKLPFVEVPVHIRYTSYSRTKGQSLTGAFRILVDLVQQSVIR
ncbi:MAG: hypothetical protein RIS94_102 [Pseudomonadota bacterium]|jgi:glycosyltransferase involved in cell wall biosynthesis